MKITDTTASQFFETWGLPLTFAIAVALHSLALAFARPSWFAMARPHDPLDEIDDPERDRLRCHACDRSYIAREMDRDPSAGHQAICAACASTPARYHAARAEARAHAISEQDDQAVLTPQA